MKYFEKASERLWIFSSFCQQLIIFNSLLLVKIILLILDLIDKQSLINHLNSVYKDVVEKNGSILLGTKQIVSSIVHYVNSNKLDLKVTLKLIFQNFQIFYFCQKFLKVKMDEILKDNLIQTNIKLKQKYRDDEQNDKLKIE